MAKVLSIKQPWASLVLPPDWLYQLEGEGQLSLPDGAKLPKDVENRVWDVPYRGPLIIHASKVYDFECGLIIPRSAELPKGALLGIVDLSDISPTGPINAWHVDGQFGWIFKNPRRFYNPIPMSGRLGLWEVSDDFIRKELIS